MGVAVGVGVVVVVGVGAVVEVLDKSWVTVGQNDLGLVGRKETESLHGHCMGLDFECLAEE